MGQKFDEWKDQSDRRIKRRRFERSVVAPAGFIIAVAAVLFASFLLSHANQTGAGIALGVAFVSIFIAVITS